MTTDATTTPSTDLGPDDVLEHDVVIVGTGFSGLAMAIRLVRSGRPLHDVLLLEKAGDLGGTWRDNTYPGCACDVPSNLYSFSYAQKPDWSRAFARQDEILGYLRDVATRYGVDRRIRYGEELVEAVYDGHGHWDLRTARGTRLRCRTLVLGTGALHLPAYPDIPGLDDFAGPVMHTARWPAGDDGLSGSRVAVIGTGASAIQIVPEIAPRTRELRVFQRTPAWVLPKVDRAFSAAEQRLYRAVPAAQRLVRAGVFWRLESRVLAFVAHPKALLLAEKVAKRHLARQVSDPRTRARLTPDYRIGCKRILLSNDYWATFERPDVHLVTDAITRVERDAVVTADGTRHEVDAIVLGTGFKVGEPVRDIAITGAGGRTLKEEWAEGMRGYLGVAVAGFPNLFLLQGPNSGLGHSSQIFTIERQVDYVAAAMALRDRRGARAVAVDPKVQDEFNADLERRSRRTVWVSGCRSWYLDRFGNNRILWPGSLVGYWWRTRRADPADLVFDLPERAERPATPLVLEDR